MAAAAPGFTSRFDKTQRNNQGPSFLLTLRSKETFLGSSQETFLHFSFARKELEQLMLKSKPVTGKGITFLNW